MDEVITCNCGNRSWIIGTSGTRCNACGYQLNHNWILQILSISEINDIIAKEVLDTN